MPAPTLSIVIANYNAEKFLRSCLESIRKETNRLAYDIWVVDNHSHDNSVAVVKDHFQEVKLIENERNVGFAKANNMAISKSEAPYILLLNPDTLILDSAIEKMVKFMDENPHVGVSGCRVLNEDGTLQLACRRSIPTPDVAFFRLMGLSKLFPNSKLMARYNLTYLDPNEPHEVDAVSGAFLMIRKKVVDVIGMLDEQFFMYGEDLDWCVRTRKAGWAVMYFPAARIIHYKGQCSRSNARKAAFEFHRAMYLFHKKHFAQRYRPVENLVIYAGIFLSTLASWRSFLFSGKMGSKG